MHLFFLFTITLKTPVLAQWKEEIFFLCFFLLLLFFSFLIVDITIKKTHFFKKKIYNKFESKCVCMFTLICSREKKTLNKSRKQICFKPGREVVVYSIYIYIFIQMCIFYYYHQQHIQCEELPIDSADDEGSEL
jgi:hypothetical protein